MKRINRRSGTVTSLHPRAGLAQVELALFLPLLAMMLLMIFTVASALITRVKVSVVARDQAWRQRYADSKVDSQRSRSASRRSVRSTRPMGSSAGGAQVSRKLTLAGTSGLPNPMTSTTLDRLDLSSLAADFGRLLNPGYATEFQDLVEATAEGQSRIFVRVVGMDQNMEINHSVMRGSWDSTAITFQDERNHKTLVADRKFQRISSDFVLDEFKKLISRAALSAVGADLESLEKLKRAAEEKRIALEEIRRNIERQQRAIDELNDRIRALERELRAAVELEEIERIKRLIRDVQHKIRQIEHAVSILKDARKKLKDLGNYF